MSQPVIASMGAVRTEVPPNRARFQVSFKVVNKSAADATKTAADRLAEAGKALTTYGAERVRVETRLDVAPLYEQYRDKDGNRVDNERADKIEAYEVTATIVLEVRDLTVIQTAYATAVAAKPTSITAVSFSFSPDNQVQTEMFEQAVADAARRAKLATEATGAHLGAVKLIDPSGRACETDTLIAGAPRRPADIPGATTVNLRSLTSGRTLVLLNGNRLSDGEPAPGLPLQPPLQTLTAQACVVYALG